MGIASKRLDDLFVRLCQSDHSAYEEIFRTMQEPLLRYVYRITKDEGLALDVLQDVFLKLWEKRQEIEIKYSLKALLYAMARNRALNINRQNSRMTFEDAPAGDLSEKARSENRIENEMHTAQLNQYFKIWIKELPPRRAEAFVLSRYHALSHREIGEIMGLAKRTVDTHIVHALRHLRARYNQIVEK